MVLLMVIKLLKLGEIMSDKKFSFRNKMVLNSYVEEEISNKFDITRKQQILVDSLITDYLKH